MDCTIPTIEVNQYGNRYEHKLEVKEAEFLLRHFMGNPMGWGAATVAIRESLIGKQYLLPGHGHFTSYASDFILAYRNMNIQARITIWAIVVFGSADILNNQERAYRHAEESLELAQSCGVTAKELHALIDYVYGRPVGEFYQEVGGTFTTLAVLCSVNDEDMMACGEKELARIWSRVDEIREKQKNKPKASPLQGQPDKLSDVVAMTPVPEGESTTVSWLPHAEETVPSGVSIEEYDVMAVKTTLRKVQPIIDDLVEEGDLIYTDASRVIKDKGGVTIPVMTSYNGPSLADTPHVIEALTMVDATEYIDPKMANVRVVRVSDDVELPTATADECIVQEVQLVYTKDSYVKAVLDMVEKHTFIKQTDLVEWTHRYWTAADINPHFTIKEMVKAGEIKAFDYVHDEMANRIKTVLYPATVNINSLLGAE